jgi:hypothetical protein
MTNTTGEDTSEAYWSLMMVDHYKFNGQRRNIMTDYFTSFWSWFLTRDFPDTLIEGE